MFKEFIINTRKKEEIIDITGKVEEIVKKSAIKEGLCIVYVPHATAAIIINENYDKNLCQDILEALQKIIPYGIWRHDRIDSNGAAHIKASLLSPSEVIPIKDNKLLLGIWQGIALVELDGPRQRKVYVKLIKENVM